MDRVRHFNHNANRVSFQLFGKDFGRLSYEQMTAVEKAIKNEFELGEHNLPFELTQ